jgi:multicomponent Na+:H+ antiporter subunit D
MGIKMALFPLHGWLPDAYTYAPPAVIPFISGAMTKVMVYVLLRYCYFIFGAINGVLPAVLEVLGWLAAAGIILASVMAIAQTDFRRMLAYSSVAQIGYIVLGIAIANYYGLIGAVLHILNHAVMKSCLFLVAGGVKWKTGEHDIAKYAEMSRSMPVTMGAFLLGALSMIGIPPTAGFFSKWYLILGALDNQQWIYIAVIIVSSLLNAVYFFRVIEQAYLRKADVNEKADADKKIDGKEKADESGSEQITAAKSEPELPYVMLVPIVVLGAGILLLGIWNSAIVNDLLYYVLPGGGGA